MKKIITLFILFVATQIFAQNNGISYQAIILNPKGEQLPGVNNPTSPLANKNICMVFKFVDEFSNIEYQETIQTKTDGFGMVNLVIGSGNQTAGYATSFKDIVWNISKKSLSVGINTDGSCSNFTEISNQEFSYVPLAFSAINAENVTGVVAIENGGTNATTLLGAKTNLQINNVDNTSDLNKPISTATQTVLSLKEILNNKSTDVTTDGNSDTKYPSVKSVKMYVDGKLLISSNALTAEATRATTAENTIAANLATETTNRTSTDATLTANLVTEVTRATAAENAIAADLTAETNRATTAESTKEALVNKSTDITADGISDTKYPTVKSVKTYVDASTASSSTALTNEITRATAAENTIATDLATETTDRISADATLTSNLATEVTRATAAENTIAADLATEITNRSSADATLTSNLATEVTRATAAENTIAADLATETTNRTSADASLQTNINSVQADVDANELATNNALALKVDKVSGKGLSTEDYTSAEKTKLADITGANTGDQDLSALATTSVMTTALGLKVDKVSGKGLSTEDYTSVEKSKLADITGTNTGDQDLSALATTSAMTTALGLKVDKVSGKGLSTEDYTSAEKTKLADITGTNTGDQDLSALATTSAMTTALGLKVDKVSGKGLSTEDYTSSEKSKLADITGTNTGDQDLSALATTSAMTTALGLKVDKVSGKGLSTEDYTSAEKTKLADITGTNTGDQDLSALATTSAMTTALGLKVDKISGKGLSTEDYTSAEKSKLADITGTNTGDQDISGIAGNSNKIGDLTSLTTTAKSSLVAAVNELETAKAPLASPTFTGTVSGITKTMVGLANVENTTDLLKPVSTATQTALDLKANLTSATFSGAVVANSIAKSGGTSSQFLMADGSVSSGGSGTTITEDADEFTATAAQISFTLSQIPSTNSKVKMYVNGIRISNAAYSVSDTTLTYIPSNNGSYALSAGDRIQFDYFH